MQPAKLVFEEPQIPDCDFPLPPYYFNGRGIVLIYEIPFARVREVVPVCFESDPKRESIWFMVNLHHWSEFHPVHDPADTYSFHEAYYKFSVRFENRLGDYPIKLYLDSDMGIASGWNLYGYPKYAAKMSSDFSTGHFKIERGTNTELDVEVVREEGLSGRLRSFIANLTARTYVRNYAGNFLHDAATGRVVSAPTTLKKVSYRLGKARSVLLREPLEWGILMKAEMQEPKYAFILPEIKAVLDPPDTAPS